MLLSLNKKQTLEEIEKRLNNLTNKLSLTKHIQSIVTMQCHFIENTADINFQKKILNTNFSRNEIFFTFKRRED